MSEAPVRSGSNTASAGAMALAVLCAQQFIMARTPWVGTWRS